MKPPTDVRPKRPLLRPVMHAWVVETLSGRNKHLVSAWDKFSAIRRAAEAIAGRKLRGSIHQKGQTYEFQGFEFFEPKRQT